MSSPCSAAWTQDWALWLSIEAELPFRLSVADGRALRVLGAITFEHEAFSG